jgi:hypothetical protein
LSTQSLAQKIRVQWYSDRSHYNFNTHGIPASPATDLSERLPGYFPAIF